MTDTTNQSPASLRAGPLAGQDLSLLKAGSSVLRSLGDKLHVRKTGDILVVSQDGSEVRRGREVVWYRTKQDRPMFGQVEGFAYLGERGEDGWITAPEGGWSENPVGSMKIWWRNTDGASNGEPVPASEVYWSNPESPVIAFRPAEAQAAGEPKIKVSETLAADVRKQAVENTRAFLPAPAEAAREVSKDDLVAVPRWE